MASNANFATTPRYEQAVCSTVNTNYDGTGTIVTLFTAATNGSRVDAIGWAAQDDSTSGRLSVFSRPSDADTWRFVASFEIPALTVSATQPPAGGGWTNLNWVLTDGAQIGFAATVAGTYMAHVTLAGDF